MWPSLQLLWWRDGNCCLSCTQSTSLLQWNTLARNNIAVPSVMPAHSHCQLLVADGASSSILHVDGQIHWLRSRTKAQSEAIVRAGLRIRLQFDVVDPGPFCSQCLGVTIWEGLSRSELRFSPLIDSVPLETFIQELLWKLEDVALYCKVIASGCRSLSELQRSFSMSAEPLMPP